MYNADMPTRADLPSHGQLARSTAIAAGVASALLVAIVLPAEYGVDPTGIGGVLGLTEMGEIKMQLAEEAALDAAQAEAFVVTTAPFEPEAPVATPPAPAPALTMAEPDAPVTPAPSVALEAAPEAPSAAIAETPAADADAWTGEVSLTLAPAQGAEIKLIMNGGGRVDYEWTVDQGHLNSALHGNGTDGQRIGYRDGRAEAQDAGTLTAAFDGRHGWFWRNRSDVDVTMTLRVRGEYSEIRRVL